MDFLSDQRLLYSSERFKPIYDHLREHYDLKLHKIFLLAMSIGFINQKKLKREGKGIEFRINYISESQDKAAVYSMILADPEIGKDIKKFNDSEFVLRATKLMEEYAEGGMEILCDEAFLQKWDGNQLDPQYKEYNIDILAYIYRQTNKAPF